MRNSYERFSQVATSVCAHRKEWTVKEKDVNSVFVELWKLLLMSFFSVVFGALDVTTVRHRCGGWFIVRSREWKPFRFFLAFDSCFRKQSTLFAQCKTTTEGEKKLLVIISPRQSLETRAKKNNTRKQKKNWREKRAAPDSWNGKANQWCLSPYMCLTFRSEKAAWGRCGGDGWREQQIRRQLKSCTGCCRK